MQVNNSNVISAQLLECPVALEQLGRGFMAQVDREADLSKIDRKGFQQLGYLIVEMMLGREFPKVNFNDFTPLKSHRVTQIGFHFVKAIVLNDKPLTPEQIQNLSAALANAPNPRPLSHVTLEGHIGFLSDNLASMNFKYNGLPPILDVQVNFTAIRERFEFIRAQIEGFHFSRHQLDIQRDLSHCWMLTSLDCVKRLKPKAERLQKELIDISQSPQTSLAVQLKVAGKLEKTTEKIKELVLEMSKAIDKFLINQPD